MKRMHAVLAAGILGAGATLLGTVPANAARTDGPTRIWNLATAEQAATQGWLAQHGVAVAEGAEHEGGGGAAGRVAEHEGGQGAAGRMA
jgi:hypothetical protein